MSIKHTETLTQCKPPSKEGQNKMNTQLNINTATHYEVLRTVRHEEEKTSRGILYTLKDEKYFELYGMQINHELKNGVYVYTWLSDIQQAIFETIKALNESRGVEGGGRFNYEFAKIRSRFTGDLISLGVFTDAVHKAMNEENKKHEPQEVKQSDGDFLASFNFK